MRSLDELTTLALAAGRGDPIALRAFVRDSQADVWRFSAHLVDRDAADDLTQDVYFRAIPALAHFRADAPARAWLLSIARRSCADAARRRTRGRALVERLAQRAATGPDVVADVSGAVELDDLLAGLDGDRRAALVLTQVLGLRYDEAAQVLGVPVGTVRSRVARGRADLIAALEPEQGKYQQ